MKIWKNRRPEPEGKPWASMASEFKLPDWLARLAWLRGVETPEELSWRLDPAMSRAYPPERLHGITQAKERILLAIERKERIGIYGDYDVDGVTATAIMIRTLEKLGADVFFFIPNRFNDGYGLHLDCIQELATTHKPSLMVSVDCGVRSVKEVAASKELGIDWVITDHHSIGPELPPACAVVHPYLDGYPNRGLAGVGVAFKLAQALLGISNEPTSKELPALDGMLKLVAIGTIADVMPLKGENALLVRRGLDAMRSGNSHGLTALMAASKIEGKPKAQQIAFGIGPRLNAVGRMGGAEDAVRLLLSKSPEEASRLMERVEQLNTERKGTQKKLSMSLIEPDNDTFDMVIEPTAHKGVIGIVAGHRMRQYGLPTAVCTVIDGIAHCSMRAPDGYDLDAMLTEARPLLTGGGGHAAAAGVSFEMANFDAVRKSLIASARQQATTFKAKPALPVDGVGDECVPEDSPLDLLEPFGQGFQPPVVVLEGILKAPIKVFAVVHWKLQLEGVKAPLTWFFGEDQELRPKEGDKLRFAATPQGSARWGRSWLVQEVLGEQAPALAAHSTQCAVSEL